MNDINVTNQVSFEMNDGECLPLIKCVCGQKYILWDNIISVYRDDANECSNCHRKLYFTIGINIWEVKD